MKKIIALEAPKIQQPKWYPVALAQAIVTIIVTTYILFTLDKTVEFITYQGVGSSAVMVTILTAAAGVFALPYLLRLTLSPLMRIVSCFAVFAAVCGWMLGAWWLEINTNSIYAAPALIMSYIALVGAFVSTWSIGLPLPALKKKR